MAKHFTADYVNDIIKLGAVVDDRLKAPFTGWMLLNKMTLLKWLVAENFKKYLGVSS